MTSRIHSTVWSLLMISGWASLAAAAAPPVVYHSSDPGGLNPGAPYALANPTEQLELFFSPGPAVPGSGTPCLNGTGDEICGITIELEPTGDVEFDAFAEDMTSDLVFNFSPPSTLVINRLNGTTGDTGPVHLGTLTVTVGAAGGDVSVSTSSQAVGANLQNLSVADNGPLAVPEPGLALSLGLGALALGAVVRRRVVRSGTTRGR